MQLYIFYDYVHSNDTKTVDIGQTIKIKFENYKIDNDFKIKIKIILYSILL